jgi:hypothetical protein
MKLKCINCNSEFEKPKEQKTCSRKCSDEFKKKNNREYRVCIQCNLSFEVKKSTKKTMCSDECRKSYALLPENKKIRIEKSLNSLKEKFGTENIFELDFIKNKSKQTKIEKYGDENYNNLDKSKQTKKEKYGDENYNNLDKSKKTKKEKYGDENYNNRIKAKETMNKDYGVNHAMMLVKYQEKQKKTLFKNYGVLHPLQNKEILNKFQNTNLNVYGFKNPSQNHKIIEKIKQTYYDNFDDTIIFDKMETMEIELISKYEGLRVGNVYNEYEFRCKKCNHKYFGTFSNHRPPICRSCYPMYKNNKHQIEFAEYFKNIDISFKENTKTEIKPFELDFYFPEKKIALELNGNYYHSEIGGDKTKDYHINKTNLCNKQNIDLIHIFEDEIIFKKDILMSMIKNKLGFIDNKLYARKCSIRDVSLLDKTKFLNDNHIQGNSKDKVRIGLYYDDKLVSVMTFIKLRKSMGNKEDSENFYELTRFCSLIDYSVVGAFSKLLKFFINNYQPKKIITFSDCRFSGVDYEKTVYHKNGFILTNQIKPRYWYFEKGDYLKRHHRFKFNKNKLLKILNIPNVSEWEIAQILGMDRIWDCGNLRFEMVF